jgi:hypothetical protein
MDGRSGRWVSWLIVLLTVGSLCLLVGACTAYTIVYPSFWAERLPAMNATYQELVMTECRGAANVSFEELCAFLANDTTETADYVYPAYSCGDFAVQLHDAAEYNGICCGIVVVTLNTTGYTSTVILNDTSPGTLDSDRGHAFNVFNTTDRGLVYIDATGVSKAEKKKGRLPHKMAVYFKEGMPLGEIALNQSESLDYDYYGQRESRYSVFVREAGEYFDDLGQYNMDVIALNGRMNLTLEIKRQELVDTRYALMQRDEAKWIMTQPFGIVDRATVYW